MSASDEAWNEFISHVRQPIAIAIIRVARRFGPVQVEVVDDLVQETFLKLCLDRCTHLLHFSSQHPDSVAAYVKTIAANVAHDFFKAHCSIKRGSGKTHQLLECLDPPGSESAQGGVEDIHQQVLLREIDECLDESLQGTYKSRDRLIFWLHYRDGMSACAIASLTTLNLTVKGVESVLLRLTRLIRARIAERGLKLTKKGTSAEGIGQINSF